MKILVPIKRVADPDNANKVKVNGAQVSSEGLEWKMNPFDEWALEAALRLTENGATKARTGEVAPGPLRMSPARAGDPAPPARHIAQVHLALGGREDQRSRHQKIGRRGRSSRRKPTHDLGEHRRALGDRHMARGLHEGRKLGIRHRIDVHEEPAHRHAVHRPLVREREGAVVSHREGAARDPHHPLRRGARRRRSPGGVSRLRTGGDQRDRGNEKESTERGHGENVAVTGGRGYDSVSYTHLTLPTSDLV